MSQSYVLRDVAPPGNPWFPEGALLLSQGTAGPVLVRDLWVWWNPDQALVLQALRKKGVAAEIIQRVEQCGVDINDTFKIIKIKHPPTQGPSK